MTTAMALAAALRSMSDEALVALLTKRMLSPQALAETGSASIADFFDLADTLRTPDSIDRALEHLPREALVALEADPGTDVPDAALEPAAALGLATHDAASGRIVVDDAVAARLRARPDLRVVDEGLAREGRGGPDAHRTNADGNDPAPALPGEDDATGAAAERAFGTLTAMAELLHAVDAGLVHELAKGGIGQPLARQLAGLAAVDTASVPELLGLLVRLEYVDTTAAVWTLHPAGSAWLVIGWPERWLDATTRWMDTLPDGVATVLLAAGTDWSDLVAVGRDRFPGGAGWLDADLTSARVVAERLGVLADEHPTAAGAALLDGDTDAALRHVAALLPDVVDSVYLQHDLTVIAPGPLAPADDALLRQVADVEVPGLATRYRISDDSIRRALAAGHDRDAIMGLLERLSATGVPQPVAYLVDTVSASAGSIVVDLAAPGTDLERAGSTVHGPAEQIELVAVDTTLRHMAWERRADDVLATRFPVTAVLEALTEARYPAVLAAAARPVVAAVPQRPITRPTGQEDRTRALVARLRAATTRGDAEPEQEWLGRQIDLAVRGRVPIRVIVRMPDGTETPFTIVPTTISGGRVRGKDTHSDVERTLPLSLVVGVESTR